LNQSTTTLGMPLLRRVESTAMTTKLPPAWRRLVAVEGSEAAFVVAETLAVDPDVGAVVGGADVEEGAGVGGGGEGEVALVPDDAFVAEDGGVLGVPVAGDGEVGGGGEVVLGGAGAEGEVGVLVEGVGVVLDLAVGGVEIGAGLVDKVVPGAVEGGGGTVVEVDEDGLEGLLRDGSQGGKDEE
jgi:hypothetical protein